MASPSEHRLAKLLSRATAATGQVRVSLGVDPDVRSAYVAAGQFVELAPTGPSGVEKGFFALLNAPGEGETLELLVRSDATVGGEAAALLLSMPIGDGVPCSMPLGRGFLLERAVGKGVRVVATGTAIAPARAAIVQCLARGLSVLSLDYGVRSEGHLALAEDLAAFARAHVEIAVHHSAPTEHGVSGALAQRALIARWPSGAAGREVVIAVGQPEMVAEVKTAWQAHGGDPLDVLQNY